MSRWKLADPVPEEAYRELSGLPRFVAALLWRRGIRTKTDAERFLDPEWSRDVHDPFLFDEMRKAVDRVLEAVEKKEKIIVHGDYDADGVSGSVILATVLERLGAEYDVFIPHREKDGYGMNPAAVRELAADGAGLIITTDCGIANTDEIALADQLGMDVIITDHHSLPDELPPAHAILHPLREGESYPFRYLTGGGVAFKFAQALWQAGGLPEGQEKWLLDMVAISTVADFGKLTGENRALVRYGLYVLNKTKRRGLEYLIESSRLAGKTLNAESIGFQIAPRINAAGRMAHAKHAFDLMMAKDAEAALRGADRLEGYNLDRREATDRIMAEASRMAASEAHRPLIVLRGNGWPAALCGLVASKLVDTYYRPAIVLGRNADGRYTGSGRSIPGFDITAALRMAGEHLEKFGGHPAACGLTAADDAAFEGFRARILEVAEELLADHDMTPTIEIEEVIEPLEAGLSTLQMLEKLEPFGEGNPRPRFLLEGVKVVSGQCVGKNGGHLKMTVSGEKGGRLDLIAFGFGTRADEARPGDCVDVVVELSVNEWNGRRIPQGMVVDMCPAYAKASAGEPAA